VGEIFVRGPKNSFFFMESPLVTDLFEPKERNWLYFFSSPFTDEWKGLSPALAVAAELRAVTEREAFQRSG
jgi:hypothetical protein